MEIIHTKIINFEKKIEEKVKIKKICTKCCILKGSRDVFTNSEFLLVSLSRKQYIFVYLII